MEERYYTTPSGMAQMFCRLVIVDGDFEGVLPLNYEPGIEPGYPAWKAITIHCRPAIAPEGIEPTFSVSKTVVLPLDEGAAKRELSLLDSNQHCTGQNRGACH